MMGNSTQNGRTRRKQGCTDLLSSFFEDKFLPVQLQGHPRSYATDFRVAINHFESALGWPPRMCDLGLLGLRRLAQHLVNNGLSRESVATFRKRITCLWRFAAEMGLAGPCPQKFEEPIPETTPESWRARPAQPGTLLYHYRVLYRPTIRGRVLRKYDLVMVMFHDFTGRQTLLADITPDLLERFRDQVGGSKGAKYANALSHVMGFAPVRSMGQQGKLPEPYGSQGTVSHHFQTRFKHEALVGTGDRYYWDFLALLRKLRACFGRELLLSELSPAILAEFLNWLLGKGFSSRSLIKYRTLLMTIWGYAHEQGEAGPLPRVRRIKVQRHQPDAWSLQELARIIDAAGKLPGNFGRVPARHFWKAILLVGWYSGLRRRSLFSIRPGDVDLQNGWIRIPPNAMKTGVGKRFRIGADAVEAVKKIFSPTRPYLFTGNLRSGSGLSQFATILKNAGVAPSKHHLGAFHKLRRTTATHVAAAAGLAAASALLGHSGPDLLKRYVDPTYLVGNDATEFLPTIHQAAAGQEGGNRGVH